MSKDRPEHSGGGDGRKAADPLDDTREAQQALQAAFVRLLERLRSIADDRMPPGKLDDPAHGHGETVDQHEDAVIMRAERPRRDQHVDEADDRRPGLAGQQARQIGIDASDDLLRWTVVHAATKSAMARAARKSEGSSVRSKLCANNAS